MTIKRKRIYEIIITGLVIILTSLCAYMGITAIQKSMKLNLSFTASPVVYCQMKIGEELVFDNLSSQIGDGVENLSGNTLTFNQDKFASTIGVESFSLTLKNYNETGSSILVEFQNATISGKTGYSEIIASGNSSTFAVTPLSLVGISMTKVTPVTLSLGAGVTLTSSNILTSTSGAQCLPFGEDLQATILLESSYENPKFTFNGNTYNITNNQLTIPAEDLTGGDVSVEVEAEQQGYTITLNLNGGSYNSSTNNVILSGYSALPNTILQIPTRDNHTFAGWWSDVISTTNLPTTQTQYYSYSYLTDSPTLTQTTTKILNNNITLHARWLPYTINTYASGHVWEGYKYITFANHETAGTSFIDANSEKIPMHWIIIGAGSNVNATLRGVANDKLPITAFGGTLNSRTGENTDNLGGNQVLLFSECTLKAFSYLENPRVASEWSESHLKSYLNDSGDSNFLEQSGLSDYLEFIKSDNIIETGTDTTEADQSMFILGASGSFETTTYLGSSYSDDRYKTFTGVEVRRWWLRTVSFGGSSTMYAASVITNDGKLSSYNGGLNGGVRPAFVLNLA